MIALPAGFETLEPFVTRWALPTTGERIVARASASMDDIRAFYEAMLAKADAAMTHIDTFPLDAMPPETERLAALVLALAQAAIAVEIHDAPRAPGTPWPNSIRLVLGAFPLG
jgi:hypothetical protein